MWMKSAFESRSQRDAESQRHNSANFLASAVKLSITPIMMIDRNLNVTYVNDATKKLLSENAVAFRSIWPGFDPDKIIGQCIDGFHKNPSHQRQLLSDPSRLPHRADITVGDLKFGLNITAVVDANRNYIGNVLEWQDVGEARMNEGRLNALQVSQATIEFTMDGRVIEANKNFLDVLGYSLQEIKGQHHSMFVDPAYRNSTEYRAFWERLNRGETVSGKFRRFGAQNKEIWLQASYNPILDRNGKPVRVMKLATDISAAEFDNNESKAKIAAIGRSQATIEFDLDGRILTANENFLSVMGYSLNDIVGKHHSMFAEPAYAGSSEYRQFWDRLNRGEFVADKFKRIGRGGKEIWIQASYNPLMDLNGKPFKVVKFATDVTQVENDRKAAEAERAKREAEQAHVVESLANGMRELSDGNLLARIEEAFAGEYEQLRGDFNTAITRLKDTMQTVLASTDGISTGAGEISQAADDLSKRTEQQAASLEETAAALEEITATVKRTTANAREAGKLVSDAKRAAEDGGRVVGTAIEAMGQIEQSSKQITDIIGVIDEIAFQTNLLALNAGVEAARAGDAGKGFAVVASEVRALAQRSSDAAKQIKALIKTSGDHVGAGVKLVDETGQSLKNIVEQVISINALVNEMAQAAEQQSTGIEEVNIAVGQMDQVTQQNAAMVEESTAACRNLADETGELSRLVGFFRVADQERAPQRQARPARETRPASRPAAAAAPRRRGNTALAVAQRPAAEEADWQEF